MHEFAQGKQEDIYIFSRSARQRKHIGVLVYKPKKKIIIPKQLRALNAMYYSYITNIKPLIWRLLALFM